MGDFQDTSSNHDSGAYGERMNWIIREHSELKNQIGKIENKFETFSEMSYSIRDLSSQVSNIIHSFNDSQTDLKESVELLKKQQEEIMKKVGKLEAEYDEASNDKKDSKKIKLDIVSNVINKIIGIILIIILIALFPQLADLIK